MTNMRFLAVQCLLGHWQLSAYPTVESVGTEPWTAIRINASAAIFTHFALKMKVLPTNEHDNHKTITQ